jgi:multidrug efflux system membrane fusion protein
VSSYPACVRACVDVSAQSVDARLFGRKRIDMRDRRSDPHTPECALPAQKSPSSSRMSWSGTRAFVSRVFARAAARGFAAVGTLSVLGALTAATACNRENAHAAAPPPMPPLVTAAPAVSRAVPTYLDEIGRNGAFESVTVTPQVPGRIVERHFQDGAQLAKGQLLFTVDPRPYQAQLNSAKAQLAETRAALDLAATQLKMYSSITDERAVSALDLETKRNTVAVDEAQVQAAQAALENAQLNLDYCYVHSPIDGRAGARLVDVGNVVQANTTALLLIQRIDPIYADFTVTERDLPQVQPKMANGTLQARVRLPSDSDSGARVGAVTFLDNTVQPGTGTVNLRATIRNADRHFWPGQFVNVQLIVTTATAVLVPSQATQISQKGPFVYVVKSDQTVELRPITLGQRHGDDVVVTTGVASGEEVVVTGQLTVAPGAKVRIAPPVGSQNPPEKGPS